MPQEEIVQVEEKEENNLNQNPVTVNKGSKQIQVNTMMVYAFPTTSLAIAGINKLSRDLYNQKNLVAQKKVDVLGGEMLTN